MKQIVILKPDHRNLAGHRELMERVEAEDGCVTATAAYGVFYIECDKHLGRLRLPNVALVRQKGRRVPLNSEHVAGLTEMATALVHVWNLRCSRKAEKPVRAEEQQRVSDLMRAGCD